MATLAYPDKYVSCLVFLSSILLDYIQYRLKQNYFFLTENQLFFFFSLYITTTQIPRGDESGETSIPGIHVHGRNEVTVIRVKIASTTRPDGNQKQMAHDERGTREVRNVGEFGENVEF